MPPVNLKTKTVRTHLAIRTRWLCGLLLLIIGLSRAGLAETPDPSNHLRIAFPKRYDPATLEVVWIEPFRKRTGAVVDVFYTHSSPLTLLTGNTEQQPVDVVFLSGVEAFDACNNKRIQPFDHSRLRESPDGVPAASDFLPDSLAPCGVNVFSRASVLAFDANAFLGNRPSGVQAFFDIDNYPGTRALPNAPDNIIEWALLSYRVPREDLYQLLSTERGLKLAFRKLDAINESTFWCDDIDQPEQLLRDGHVVMASGYADFFFEAKTHGNQSIETIWDGQILDLEQLAISSNVKNKALPTQFITYVADSGRLSDYARRRLIGPMRQSSAEAVWSHVPTGVDIREQLPTHAKNLERAVFRDIEWYARTRSRLHAIYESWYGSQERKSCEELL